MSGLAFVPVLNKFDVARDALLTLAATTGEGTRILALDNGSGDRLAAEPWLPERVLVARVDENVGNYPAFGIALEAARGLDWVAVMHSDFFAWEQGWDARLDEAFRLTPGLGLVGAVGARGLVKGGGREWTMLNFQGRRGSRAEDHGVRVSGLEPAAVVDGCFMAFRAPCLAEIGIDPAFPPHHFYDRLMPCQAVRAGWLVAVLGIACDHLGGQTANHDRGYHALAERWCRARGVAEHPAAPGNWDLAVYAEAERQFLGAWDAWLPLRAQVGGGGARGWAYTHG